MIHSKFIGTGCAIITPFNDDKTIDFASLEKLAHHLIQNGVDYLVFLGTTAESATLTSPEKNQILDFAVEKFGEKIPIVAGFGGNDTAAIIENIKSRDFEGIDAILCVSPYYNKPSQRGIIAHYTEIADNSPVPLILYNVPGRTSSNMTAETTLTLAKHKNIMAIKEASGNLGQIMEIIKHKPDDFLVISGDDALTYPMICLGGNGVISVVAMAEPQKMSDMVRYAIKGNFNQAKRLHYEILDITKAIFEDGNPAGIKAALHLKNFIKYNLRLPLVQVNDKVYDKIKKLV